MLDLARREKTYCHGAMYVESIIRKGVVNWKLDVSGVMRSDITLETI